jgi:anti-sigma28 factor (negative regulator of flagellin synthesis)
LKPDAIVDNNESTKQTPTPTPSTTTTTTTASTASTAGGLSSQEIDSLRDSLRSAQQRERVLTTRLTELKRSIARGDSPLASSAPSVAPLPVEQPTQPEGDDGKRRTLEKGVRFVFGGCTFTDFQH